MNSSIWLSFGLVKFNTTHRLSSTCPSNALKFILTGMLTQNCNKVKGRTKYILYFLHDFVLGWWWWWWLFIKCAFISNREPVLETISDFIFYTLLGISVTTFIPLLGNLQLNIVIYSIQMIKFCSWDSNICLVPSPEEICSRRTQYLLGALEVAQEMNCAEDLWSLPLGRTPEIWSLHC